MKTRHYQVIVVGGGHAGAEAAAASARIGAQTLLITHSLDALGQLSCNPAIGGVGKGHIVKEISAMGGVMPIAADAASIHWRTLNASKGPAVQASRSQADRQVYRVVLRELLENTPNLYLFQQGVKDLILSSGRVTGVTTDMGLTLHADRVVLTTGTFLSGKIHIGLAHMPGGRAGDPCSTSLSQFLRETPSIRYGRLKTGTPPRLARNSIDVSSLEKQASERASQGFDLWEGRDYPTLSQMDCFITHTQSKTHDIIAKHLDQSPMFMGHIEGKGPRYCPSIEDKIHRFKHQASHQVFLEPEGLHALEVYPNGISTSLPFEAQVQMVHSIPGLERAHITRPGYAIEYDFFNPQGLYPWLESKHIQGLFFAGQINGTTGYEEAAGQGLIAGLNAARMAKGQGHWYPTRDQAYLGVLVDDLINQGTLEPYRMFTSRAEYRLLLREDNAQERLSAKAIELGLLTEKQQKSFAKQQAEEQEVLQGIKQTLVVPDSDAGRLLVASMEGDLSEPTSLFTLTKRQGITADVIMEVYPYFMCKRALNKVLVDQKYHGYIERQKKEIVRSQNDEACTIPKDFDFSTVLGLSHECLEKLKTHQPFTLGQASRVSGVTPAAISLLRVALKKHKHSVASHIPE